MSDQAITELINACAGLGSKLLLWVADEHPLTDAQWQDLARLSPTLVSNRINQVRQAQHYGINARFNDYQLTDINTRWEVIAVRAPKERAVMHHLVNQSAQVLAENGRLLLSGYKNEGIKTHIKRAGQRLGGVASTHKFSAQLSVAQVSLGVPGSPLPDDNYSQLRVVMLDGVADVMSKPGLYGWQKVDRASAFLMDQVLSEVPDLRGKSVLDLGCGYGYLSLRALTASPEKLFLTDNCAAAINAAQANMGRYADADSVQILADDCAQAVKERFDIILCNPPFHEGFSSFGGIHDRFLRTMARLLSPQGRAYVVVNEFIRLSGAAADAGLSVVAQSDSAQGQFRVYTLSLPA